MKTDNKCRNIIEFFFLFVLCCYLLFVFFETTTISPFIPDKTENVLFWLLFGISAVKIISLYISENDGREKRNYIFLSALPVAVIWMLVYRNDAYRFLTFLAVLTVGCIGLNYKIMLKLYVIVIGTSVLTAVLCALGGAITNLVYNQGDYLRSSWGIGYPTDFSAYLLYISLAAWIAWDSIPDTVFLLVAIIDFLIAKEITHTNTSVYCSTLFFAFITWHILARKFADKRIVRFLQKAADFLSCAVSPIFAASMIGLVYAYHKGVQFAAVVDNWTHCRLSNASNMFDQVGLSLFGSPFENIGNGGTTFYVPGYNFVDCSYLLIMLRYGVITLLVLCLLWVLMTRKAIKIADRRLALSMALIAVHSISEHHFTEINFNILLILPFAVFGTDKCLAGESSAEKRKETWIRCAFILGFISCFFLLLPYGLSCFRTLSTITNIGGDEKRRTFLFAFVFAALLFVNLFVLKSAAFLTDIILKRKPEKRNGFLLVTMIALALSCLFIVSYTIDYAADNEYNYLVEEDKNVVHLLQGVNHCSLYVDDLPELYRRSFGGIATSIFDGEDLSRLKNVAVICDVNKDIDTFIRRGFLYTEISDNHSIYTNSNEAITALGEAGFKLTNYYSHNCSVDMEQFSKSAGISLSENGTIDISLHQPLIHGPYLSLYPSTYDLTFRLSMFPPNFVTQNNLDEIMCILRVSTYYGANLVYELPIYRSEFDDNGKRLLSFSCYIPGAPGVEFLLIPQISDIYISLEGINYQKEQ